jgi:hypothetical protein
MGTSPATVKRQWAMARAWLKRSMEGSGKADTEEVSDAEGGTTS